MSEFKKIRFKIIGINPLLCNNPDSMALVEQWKKENGNNLDKMPPKDAARMGVYLSSGKFVLPVTQFRESLLWGCRGHKIKKFGAATILSSAVFFDPGLPNMILTNVATGKPFEDFEIDSRYVVVGTARIMRHRPMFQGWGGEISFNYDHKRVDEGLILDMLRNGGETSGAGDFRVSKGGWFGTFNAEIIK